MPAKNLRTELTERIPKVRSNNGSALSEFGPAVFLLIFFCLIPVIDFIFIGMDYAALRYLNELQLREAQKLPRSLATAEEGSVIASIPANWSKSLLAGLKNPDHAITTKVNYQPVPWQPVGSNQTIDFWFVTVETTVQFRPLLNIPLVARVAGLGAPVTFTVSGRRPVENNRFLSE